MKVLPEKPTFWEIEDEEYWLADVLFLVPWDKVSAYSWLHEKQFITSNFRWVRRKYYDIDEVKYMLSYMHEYYNIQESDKFRQEHLSNFSDEPQESAVLKAIDEDINSFII